MTTNSTEYQKAYQRQYRKTHPQKQYKKVKREVKLEVKKLTPPRAPTKVEIAVNANKLSSNGLSHKQYEAESADVDASTTDSKSLAIDFSYLANNSSFQRAIIEFIKKYIPGFENVNPRGSKEVVIKNLNQNINNYKNVMK